MFSQQKTPVSPTGVALILSTAQLIPPPGEAWSEYLIVATKVFCQAKKQSVIDPTADGNVILF